MKNPLWKRVALLASVPVLELAGLSLPSTSAEAQEVSVIAAPSSGGWIGITFEFTRTVAERGERTVVVVTGVAEGSPAEEAGIQVGDTLTSLDGQPVTEEVFSSLASTLRPGDLVRLVVEREGRSREVLVEAASRPASYIFRVPEMREMVIKLDTLKGAILKNLDSLRMNFAEFRLDDTTGNFSIRLRTVPGWERGESRSEWTGRSYEILRDTLRSAPSGWRYRPEAVVPFEALLALSPQTDSLRKRLSAVREELTRVRRDELSRRRELEALLRGAALENELRKDELTRKLRIVEDSLVEVQKRLLEELQAVREHEVQRQFAEVQAEAERMWAEAGEAREAALRQGERGRAALRAEEEAARQALELSRYTGDAALYPLLWGQNVLLGAQLAPLNPDLASYFGVEQGVVVLQALRGTPAADAGLQGGDVIVRVADREVASIGDLRTALAASRGPLRLELVRKGKPLQIELRR